MRGSCHCGRVAIRTPGPPAILNQCNCTLCTKLGALWGYYPASDVAIVGEPRAYLRADAESPRLSFHFCGACGATTHWSAIEPSAAPRLGVNMRLFEPAELQGIEVRYGDRRNAGRGDPPRQYREPAIFDGAGVVA